MRTRDGVSLDFSYAAYLRFATESRAITNLIEARYHCTSKEPLHNPDGWPDSRILIGDDQAGWRWHQVEDLLTVYYFGLYEDWRVRILDVNSRGYEDRIPLRLRPDGGLDQERRPATQQAIQGSAQRRAPSTFALCPSSSKLYSGQGPDPRELPEPIPPWMTN